MTVTDTLETLIRMTGGPQYAAQMMNAGKSVEKFSKFESLATASGSAMTSSLEGMIGGAGGGAGLAGLAKAFGLAGLAIGATIATLAKGTAAFREVQDGAFRTAVVLKNLGSTQTVESLSQIGAEIQRISGFDDDLAVSVGGLLARFGVAGQQIPKALMSIADTAAATGETMNSIGDTVGRALLGQTRGLKELGINFTATGNKARDLMAIEAQLSQRFAGAAAARRDTITGSVDALRNSTDNFFSAIGRIASPAVIGIVNKTADAIQFFAEQIERAADFLHAPRAENAAARIGSSNGDPKQTALLESIDRGVNKMSDALVRQVLGGPGTVARGAATARDVRLAFAI
jgi:hypothetical protein